MSDVKDPVEVIVKLAPAATAPGSSEYLAVRLCMARTGVLIKPLHQSASERALATYFVAHVDPSAIDNGVEGCLCETT